MKLYHYSGAGNNFLLADVRTLLPADRSKIVAAVVPLCAKYSTDGMMLLEKDSRTYFKMSFFNPDGSTGMMCGNGGRCIVALAAYLGLVGSKCVFTAPDGVHSAYFIDKNIIRLSLGSVSKVEQYPDGIFLNTGTRHLVCKVQSVERVDVETLGQKLRYAPEFAPEGVNVNFLESRGSHLYVRTYEKGVERETLACGTGIAASAVAAYTLGIPPAASMVREGSTKPYWLRYDIIARSGDLLSVDFFPEVPTGEVAADLFLTGPAVKLNEYEYTL